ncbi:MAG: PEP-CTERM sorting domain-containing protein [Fimbriimonadales bacterium]|nr:PEP-CTERM sorting domain-containing protein [Fimbriimonadales bacterium]
MKGSRLIWAFWSAAGALSLAQAQLYDFTVVAPPSGISGNLSIAARTQGTLIGNYDPDTNPTGTRTKPGIFGPFGPRENVPVNVSIGAAISGNVNRRASGTFRATVDGSTNTLTFENLSLNFLANGAAVLPVTLTIAGQSFRTRNPDSVYILPSQGISIPIGSVNLSQFTAVQTGAGAGVLTPTGPNQYDFTAGVLVDLTLAAELLGTPFAQTFPFVLPLQGQVVVSGNTALITSLQQVNFSQTFNPNLELPPFEFGLPTILPPGQTANLIFNLTLEEVGLNIDLDINLRAEGTLVPEPASWSVLGLGLAVFVRRRRGYNKCLKG